MSAVEEVAHEAVSEVAEAGHEVVHQAAEWVGEFSRKDLLIQYAVVGTFVGAAVGVGVYFWTKKKVEKEYDEKLRLETAQAKAFYARLNKQGDVSTPQKAAEKFRVEDEAVDQAVEALKRYQGGDEENAPTPEEEGTPVVQSSVNVFLQSETDDTFDYDQEMKTRSPDSPYVISNEEFGLNESEFSQVTLTYYRGDGVLTDEREKEIPFSDPVVGDKNLERFGHGSGDPRIVYVRNERLSAEYEIVMSDGKYAHEVLGFEHSDGGSRGRRQDSELRRFRGERE